MGAVHVPPGTTFSNVKIKGDYDAEGRATFTLRELEKVDRNRDRWQISSPHPFRAPAPPSGGLARSSG